MKPYLRLLHRPSMRGSEAKQAHCPLGDMVQLILKGWVEVTSSTTHFMSMHIP